MSNYKVGDIIRLTRQAMGMSQEELCADICSVQTLSRIENGRVSVKKRTYQQLMERMGRDGKKNYSRLATKDFGLMDIMEEVNTAIFRHDYVTAEKKLEVLKDALSMEEEINYIFVKGCEAIIDAGLKRISKGEELEILEELLELTLPNYKNYLDKVYPFMREEIILLMNIAGEYGELGENKLAINIYYMLIRSMNMGYMKLEDSIQITIMLISDIARVYGGIGERDGAIAMCWNAIVKAKKNRLYTVLPKCYGEIAWNMMKQIKNGERSEIDAEVCRQYLRQGYAVAVLSKQNHYANIIQKVYMDFFAEDIYCSFQVSNGDSSGSSPKSRTSEL